MRKLPICVQNFSFILLYYKPHRVCFFFFQGQLDERRGHPSIANMPSRIVLEVSGSRYETWDSTLCRYPNTLLGNETTLNEFYNESRKAYCFNRNRDSFDAILFYYQSGGILARPMFVSEKMFVKELEFFKIKEPEITVVETPSSKCGRKLYHILEFPHLSLCGAVLANFSFYIIILSEVTFCVETIFFDRRKQTQEEWHETPWFLAESLFITWFTIEYAMRVISSPNRLKFIRSFLGIVDLLSVLPYYISLLLGPQITNVRSKTLLRLFPIIRTIKLLRHSSGLDVLLLSLRSSVTQITSLTLLVIITVIFSSSVMFLFEHEHNKDQFQSIPHSMWFSIITLTGVGYGDVIPITGFGKVTATCTIFLGMVIFFYLFIPIYITHFTYYYNSDRDAMISSIEDRPNIYSDIEPSTDRSSTNADQNEPSTSIEEETNICDTSGSSFTRSRSRRLGRVGDSIPGILKIGVKYSVNEADLVDGLLPENNAPRTPPGVCRNSQNEGLKSSWSKIKGQEGRMLLLKIKEQDTTTLGVTKPSPNPSNATSPCSSKQSPSPSSWSRLKTVEARQALIKIRQQDVVKPSLSRTSSKERPSLSRTGSKERPSLSRTSSKDT